MSCPILNVEHLPPSVHTVAAVVCETSETDQLLRAEITTLPSAASEIALMWK